MTLGQVLWRSVDDLQRRSVTGQPECWYSVMYSTSKPFSIVSMQYSQRLV